MKGVRLRLSVIGKDQGLGFRGCFVLRFTVDGLRHGG